MNIKIKINSIVLFFGLILIISCNPNKEFDDYYKVKNDQPTVYRILRDSLPCNMFADAVDLVDSGFYKKWLDVNNVATVFAPTDEAFLEFLKTKNVTTVADFYNIDKNTKLELKAIVEYSLLPDIYTSSKFIFVSQPRNSQPFTNFSANRRYTMYSSPSRMDSSLDLKKEVRVICENNKYIPIYKNTENASDIKVMTKTDLSTTLFNVSNAQVIKEGLVGKNGCVFLVNKVLTPLPSADEYIASDPNLSLFNKLLNNNFAAYIELLPNTDRIKIYEHYSNLYPGQKLYIKSYTNLGKNSENLFKWFSREYTDSTQFPPVASNGRGYGGYKSPGNNYGFVIPNNDALNTVFEKFYKTDVKTSIEMMTVNELKDLFSNCLVLYDNGRLVPSGLNKYGTTPLSMENDVEYTTQVSNGQLYVLKKMIPTNRFSSVLSRVLKNVQYTTLNTVLTTSNLESQYTNLTNSYSLFLVSDANLKSNNFYLSKNVDSCKMIIQMQTVAQKDSNYSGYGFVLNLAGVYINYNNNVLKAAGNFENNTSYTIDKDSLDNMANGQCYFGGNSLFFKGKDFLDNLKKDANHSEFYKLIEAAGINTIKSIISTHAYFTVFVPSNDAILKDKSIPAPPTATDPLKLQKEKFLKQLVLNHFIDGQIFTTSTISSSFNTFNEIGVERSFPIYSKIYLKVLDPKGVEERFEIKDSKGTVQYGPINDRTGTKTNVLSNSSTIHYVDEVIYF